MLGALCKAVCDRQTLESSKTKGSGSATLEKSVATKESAASTGAVRKRAACAPCQHPRNVLCRLALAELDRVRPQVDGVPAEPEEALQQSRQLFEFTLPCSLCVFPQTFSKSQKAAAEGDGAEVALPPLAYGENVYVGPGRAVSKDTRVRIDGLVNTIAIVLPANGL